MSTSSTSGKALLVMDIQKRMMGYLPDPQPLLNNIAKAIAAAREAGIPVIYAILGFRAGYPEISADNAVFSGLKTQGAFLLQDEATEMHEAVRPLEGEIIVNKKRVSAFTGSDLHMVLQGQGIKHLVLTGFATSGIVLSTVREAFDKDFAQTVLSDSCADPSQEVHDFLITKLFPTQATVQTTDEWVSSLA